MQTYFITLGYGMHLGLLHQNCNISVTSLAQNVVFGYMPRHSDQPQFTTEAENIFGYAFK